ncbi:MAG: LysR family transcriptional regulator, partial [Gammaproteobacteria bacterium]
MDRLETMRTFVRVAEVGSFSGAARVLGLSAPVVSRQVADLERHLGIRLFNRTTRRVELSEAGQDYYPRCVDLLDRIAGVEAEVAGLTERPSGMLRVSMPMDF